jgi:BirA family transcriptional regulator, biotin operon repressor / biotin---[acetyl-CoA-carboxylase] ligase
MPINTLFVGKVLLAFEELPSTNAHAQALLATDKPIEGTVITAAQQPAGRGQHGSSWESEAGKNLTCSVVLHPGFLPAAQHFALNKVVSLAVRETVAHFCPDQVVKIKWPNDIYIGDAKTCGILIQNTLQRDALGSSIIGIGLNVNQVNFSAWIPNPTSLCKASGLENDLMEVLAHLCQNLEARYLQLKAGKIPAIDQAYLDQLYRFQETSIFQRPNGEVLAGKIIGLDAIGKLMVQFDGWVERFDLKEVRLVVEDLRA